MNVGQSDTPSDRAAERSFEYPAYAPVAGWSRISGMGRSTIYEALSRGDLRAIKLGTRTLIDVGHGLAFLDSRPVAAIRPHGAKTRDKSA